jgi:hypothetical protein
MVTTAGVKEGGPPRHGEDSSQGAYPRKELCNPEGGPIRGLFFVVPATQTEQGNSEHDQTDNKAE